jgi:hypothetical protein
VVVPCHSCHGQIKSALAEEGVADICARYLWEMVADAFVCEPSYRCRRRGEENGAHDLRLLETDQCA